MTLKKVSLFFFLLALFTFLGFGAISPVKAAQGYTLLCDTTIPSSATTPARHRLPSVRGGYISQEQTNCSAQCTIANNGCTANGSFDLALYKCTGYSYQQVYDNGNTFQIPGCLEESAGFSERWQKSSSDNPNYFNLVNEAGGQCDVTYQVDLIPKSGVAYAESFMVYHTNSTCTCTGSRPRLNITFNGTFPATGVVESGWLSQADINSYSPNGIFTPPSGLKIISMRGAYFDNGTGYSLVGGKDLRFERLVNNCVTSAQSPQVNSYDATFTSGCMNGAVVDNGVYRMQPDEGASVGCPAVEINLGNNAPTPTPTPTCATCTAVACPTGIPQSKFRTTSQSQTGSQTTCSNPVLPACPQPTTSSCTYSNYVNTTPTCSMKINGSTSPITISRSDPNPTIELTVTDPDYGDTVDISSAIVSSGRCGLVRTTTGADAFGSIVRLGGSNPAITSQTTQFIFNHKIAHGVYQFNTSLGKYVCQGSLTVTVRDLVGDANDSSRTSSCSVGVTIIDEPPVVSDISIQDTDEDSTIRTMGNLITGIPTLSVSNNIFTSSRPTKCTSPVSLGVIGFPCSTTVSAQTRKNPIEVSVTLTDADGINDIERIGLGLQYIDPTNMYTKTRMQVPVVVNGVRRAVYGVYTQSQDDVMSGNTFWVPRADLTKTLIDPTTSLFGLRYFRGTGGLSQTQIRQLLPLSWFAYGYPDCYLTQQGCNSLNISTTFQDQFYDFDNQSNNYLFDMRAPSNSYLCYNSNFSPTVKTGTCDSSCAACLRRSPQNGGIEQVDSDKVKASFSLQMNDSLLEGEYALFVWGGDKQGVNINSKDMYVISQLDFVWNRVRKDSGVCMTGVLTVCPDALVISLDKTAPSYTVAVSDVDTNDFLIHASVNNVVDAGAGVSSETNIYKTVFYWVDHNNPSTRGFIKSAKINEGNCDGNTLAVAGVQACSVSSDDPLVNGKWEMVGDLLQSGIPVGITVDVYAQYCIMDDASNGTCITSPALTATYAGAQEKGWIKTSLGPLYSNVVETQNPFDIALSADPAAVDSSSTSLLYPPFTQQTKSIAGSLVSAANASSTLGLQNAKLGFGPTYRNPEDTNSFTFRGYVDSAGSRYSSGWYTRLLSLFQYNCNKTGTNNCVSHATASAAMTAGGTAPNFATLNANISISDTVCTGKSIVFVQSGTTTITGQITQNPGAVCIFVVADGATIEIADTVTGGLDKVYATFVVDGTFRTNNVAPTNDRLEIFGGIFSSKNAPLLERKLSNTNNKSYPSEWLVYNSSTLELFRDWFGVSQESDIKCGASGHPVCN